MSFTRRPLAGQATLGERLKQLRLERRLTPAEVSSHISVPAKYLEAIEEGRYDALPGLVYARNFVRQYAAFLHLPADSALERFEEEYQVVQGRRVDSPRLVPRANTEFPWYIRHARFLAAAVVVMAVATYLIAQVVHLVHAPLLEVVSPATDISTQQTSVRVSGRTEPGVQVRINNEQTEVDSQGQFTEVIDLQSGLNTLKITAARKYSQTAVIERRVLLEQPTSTVAP